MRLYALFASNGRLLRGHHGHKDTTLRIGPQIKTRPRAAASKSSPTVTMTRVLPPAFFTLLLSQTDCGSLLLTTSRTHKAIERNFPEAVTYSPSNCRGSFSCVLSDSDLVSVGAGLEAGARSRFRTRILSISTQTEKAIAKYMYPFGT
jgi:hypothetical protein